MSTNGHAKGYIPDGYTKKACILSQYNLHPTVRFEYRPCLISQQAIILETIQRDSATRKDKLLAEMLASRIVTCDLADFASNVEFLLKLEPKLFDRMCNVVLGNEGGDEDPHDTGCDTQYSNQRQAELSAALSGQSVEEHDAKN